MAMLLLSTKANARPIPSTRRPEHIVVINITSFLIRIAVAHVIRVPLGRSDISRSQAMEIGRVGGLAYKTPLLHVPHATHKRWDVGEATVQPLELVPKMRFKFPWKSLEILC